MTLTYAPHVSAQIVKMARYLQGIIKSEFADTHHYHCTDPEDFKKKYIRYHNLITQAKKDSTFPEPAFFVDSQDIYRYHTDTSHHIIPPDSNPATNDTYLLFFPFKLRHLQPQFTLKFLAYQSEGYGAGFDTFLRAYLIEWESKDLIKTSTGEICKVWLDEKPDWKQSKTPPPKGPPEKKDPTFLELFKHNEERMNRFFELLKSDRLNAIDNEENWIYNTRKNSLVACFEALEELGFIKTFNKSQLQRVVAKKIKFKATDKLFRNPTNSDDYQEFYSVFEKYLT